MPDLSEGRQPQGDHAVGEPNAGNRADARRQALQSKHQPLIARLMHEKEKAGQGRDLAEDFQAAGKHHSLQALKEPERRDTLHDAIEQASRKQTRMLPQKRNLRGHQQRSEDSQQGESRLGSEGARHHFPAGCARAALLGNFARGGEGKAEFHHHHDKFAQRLYEGDIAPALRA